MKKSILILLLVLIFPAFVNAENAELKKITVSGVDKTTVNSEVELSFNITYSGLDKKTTEGYGLGGYVYQLDFDDNVFIPTKISKNDFFDTKIYKDEKGKYYVVGVLKKDNKSKEKCSDNTLYCSNVKDTITFSVRMKSEDKNVIKLYSASSYLYKIGSDLESTDRMIIDSIQNISKTIKISDSSSKSVKANNIAGSINGANIEKFIENVVKDYKETVDEKSNNYLSNLEVSGYKISFDKRLLTYDIVVGETVNSLEVTATPENENAKVEINGEDDLKLNDYVVEITVTSENGKMKTYKINALKNVEGQEDVIETQEDLKEFVQNVKNKFDDKTVKRVEIIGAAVVGVVVIVGIVKLFLNSKLNKKMKDFDKF